MTKSRYTKQHLLILFLCLSASIGKVDLAFGQTGPGGVGDNSSNVLWLDASTESYSDDDPVDTWTDLSGNGNDATQAGGSRPLFKTSIINGFPVVRFAGDDDYYESVVSNSSSNATVYAVFAHDHDGASSPRGPVWSLDNTAGTSGLFPRYSNNNQYASYGSGWMNKTSEFTQGQFYVTSIFNETGSSTLYLDGTSNHTTGTNAISPALMDIGRRNTSSDYFKGDLAEIIYYNTDLNDAQRMILDNYLGAKYGIAVATDYYDYESTHNYAVAGIGQEGSDTHTEAQSANLIRVSDASDISATGEFLMFGHDNGSITSWTSTEAPNGDANVQRVAREWRFDHTGDVGTVTLALDTADLPAKTADYGYFLLWTDDDGDFSSGATAHALTLNGDDEYEVTGLTISNGTYLTISIFKPSVEFTSSSDNDFESNTSPTVNLTLNYAMAKDLTVTVSDAGTGTATAGGGNDYTLPASATITSGNTSGSFDITVNNVDGAESDETINITLTSPSEGEVGTISGFTYTINDDDYGREIYFNPTSSSGSEGVTSVNITVETSTTDASDMTVEYSVTGGTATGSGTDYTLAAGTATVTSGLTTTTIALSIVDDVLDEADETVIIELSNPSNVNLGANTTFTYTVTDDDVAPTVGFLTSTSYSSEDETTVDITINLSGATSQDVTVDYSDAGSGSATGSGTDYTFTGGTATITAGLTSTTFSVTLTDDGSSESPETVVMNLADETNASLGTSTHTLTINDNDLGGTIGPGGVGDEDNTVLWLDANKLTLSDADDVSTWSDFSGNGNDATQAGGNRPTFQTGELNGKPVIRFAGDDDHFADVVNSTSANATVYAVFSHDHDGASSPRGPVWSLDNSASTSGLFPRYSNNTQYASYGSGWMSKTSEFTQNQFYITSIYNETGNTTLYLDGTSNHTTGTNAISPANFDIGRRATTTDYLKGDIAEILYFNTDLNDAQRIIVDNYLSAKYDIAVATDVYAHESSYGEYVAGIGRVDASNEHLGARSDSMVGISNPTDLGDGEYLLFGHDGGAVASWTTTEAPNSGTNTYRLSREWKIDETGDVGAVTLTLDTANLPAKPAGYNQYVLFTDADGDFSSGATTYSLELIGSSYTYNTVNLTDNHYIAIGMVKPTVEFSAETSNADETTAASITISLSMEYAVDVTVDYAVSGGTATGSNDDYTLASGTATILAGQTTTTINPVIINDTDVESDETIEITLSNPSDGTELGTNTVHTYTINDDDNSRKIDFQAASSGNGEGTASANITVEINSADGSNPTTVQYAVTGGTATGSGTDFTLASGTATISSGLTTTTFSIAITDDVLDEDNETVIITLSSPTNANLGTDITHTYTITDDDDAPTIEFINATSLASEDADSVTITVGLSAVSGQDVTVEYADEGSGTATGSGTDFTLPDGTATITAGNTTGTFKFAVTDDGSEESNETVVIELSSPSGATLGTTTQHTLTINDNDNTGYVGPGGVGNSSTNVLWLNASSLSYSEDDQVTTWDDLSGNGNDATQSGGSTPVFKPGIVNGEDVVRFAGDDDFYEAVVNNTSANATVYAVFAHDHDGASSPRGPVWSLDNTAGTSGLFPRYSNNNQYASYGSGWMNKTSEIAQGQFYVASIYNQTGSTTLYLDGTSNHSTGTNAISPALMDIGRRNTTSDYFKGDIAEMLYFNTDLNDAQRIIVDNYLGAKYDISVANDYYDFESVHGKGVAGIGREDGSNEHTAAQSAGILTVTTPSDLGDGEYLLFGHDDVAAASWTDSEVPTSSSNIQRLAREWHFDETGDVGSITIGIDTTDLPAKPSGYTQYVMWIDDDGDFTSGTTEYLLTLAGGLYTVNDVAIANNDYMTIGMVQPVVEFDASTGNGDENSTATITVNLTSAISTDVTVDYAVTGGSATGSGTDYTLADGTLTISAGLTSASINPTLINDVEVESDETIEVTLSDPIDGTILGSTTVHTYSINDDDNSRKIQFSSTSDSGAETTDTHTITVEINSADSDNPTTADYSITGGTATDGGVDATLADGTLTIPAGVGTSNTFDLSITNDLLYESSETVIISLSNPSNANLGANTTFTYTITDDDSEPEVGFLDSVAYVSEDGGSKAITVALTAPSGSDVTIDYAVHGSSTASGSGVDYTLADGTLTISAGSSSADINIPIVDDVTEESTETIVLELDNPSGATLGNDTLNTLSINDNDNTGFVGPGGVGNSSSTILWLDASSLGYSDDDQVTTWTDLSGNGNDATQSGGSTPTFQTSELNSLPVVRFAGDDDYYEDVVSNGSANAMIYCVFAHDHDGASSPRGPAWSLDNSAGTSGFFPRYSNNTQYASYGSGWMSKTSELTQGQFYIASLENATGSSTLYLDGTSNHTTATNAISPGLMDIGRRATTTDYLKGDIAELIYYNTDLNSAQRIIVDNYLSAKYGIAVSTDQYANEGSHPNDLAGIGQVDGSNSHTQAQSAGILHLADPSDLDDGEYVFFGHDGGDMTTWTTTEKPSDITNAYRLAGEWIVDETGDVGTVTLGLDITDLPAAPAGYSEYVIWTDSDGDFSSGATMHELTLSGSYYLAGGSAIADGDYITIGMIKPSIEFTSTTGNGSETTAATIEVTLDMARGSSTTVDYTVTGGTATSSTDYVLASGTVTILAGQTTANINPSILNDTEVESDETIEVTISNPSSGVALGDNTTHTYSINDDDNSRKIDFAATSSSGDEATSPVVITVEINSADATNPTTVDYAATSGTATGGGTDYTLASGTATIPNGVGTSTTFNLTIDDDALSEGSETVVITLSNPDNANLGTDITYTYTITDNDAEPTIQFSSTSSSGSEGTTPAAIQIELSAASGQDVTVDYEATNGTATGSGTDYTLANGTATITAGNTTGFIWPVIVDDSDIETPETFSVSITDPSGATMGGNTNHTYTITDNDASSVGITGPGGVGSTDGTSELDLWLKADALSYSDNDDVDTWDDASGNGNDATAAGGARPIFKTSIVNGEPVVRFNGTTHNFQDVFTASGSNASIFTVFYCEHTGSSTPNGPLWQLDNSTGSSGFFPRYSNNNQYLHYGGGWLNKTTTISQNTWYISLGQHETGNTELIIDGTSNHSTASNTVSLASMDIGIRTSSSNYYDGDIAEIIYFTDDLNSTQQLLITNYLSAKYNIAVATDIFAESQTQSFRFDVAGIGMAGASDYHTGAAAGMIEIGDPDALATGDYLMFGHNDSIITSWSGTEVPNDAYQRIRREWFFDHTNDVGTISITLDTTDLPARPAGYNDFYLLTDTDNDFTSGATATKLTDQGTDQFIATGVTIADDTYMTIAVVYNATDATGFWDDGGTWTTGTAPASGETANIVGTDVVTLRQNETVGAIEIATGATLDIGSYTLTLDEGCIELNGSATITMTTGTIQYTRGGDQCVTGNSGNFSSYTNLVLDGSGTKTLEGDINVDGNLTIDENVVFDVSGSDYNINLAGDWDNSGTFTYQESTLTLDGTGDQDIDDNSGTASFYALSITNTAGTIEPSVDLDITNDLTIAASAVLDIDANTENLTVGGNWTNNNGAAGFVPGAQSVTFDGSANQSITNSAGSENFYNLNISNTGGAVQPDDDLDIDNALTIMASTGVLDMATNGQDLTIGGAWNNNNGASGFLPGSQTVTFNNASDKSILNSSGTETFHHLNVSNTGGSVRMGSALDLSGDLTILGGTGVLDASTSGKNLSLAGNWTNNNGAGGFLQGDESVTFDGGADQGISNSSGTETFYNLNISNTAGAVKPTSTLDIDGDLTILAATGVLDVATNGINITIAGDWTNNNSTGGFLEGDETVTFDNSSNSTITNSGGTEAFYDLNISNTGGSVRPASALDIANDLTILATTGVLNMAANNEDMTIAGNWTNNNGASGFSPGTGSVTFDGGGSSDQTISNSAGTETFYSLNVNNTGNTVLPSVDLDLGGNLTILATTGVLDMATNDLDMTIAGDWTNNNGAGGFLEGDQVVTFDGASDQTITNSAGTETFYTLNISNTAGAVEPADHLDIDQDLTILSGTGVLDMSTSNMDVALAGAWTNNNGASGFVPGTGTVTFNGGSDKVIYNSAGTETFAAVAISNTGGSVIANANLDLSGNLTIMAATGVLDMSTNGKNINIAGSWTNNNGSGGFVEGDETVTFDGSSAQTLTNASGESFYNLNINKASNDLTLGGGATVTNTLTFSSGDIVLDDYDLTLDNSATMSGASASSYVQAYESGGSGELVKNYNSTGTSITFPIGDNDDYTPVTLKLDAGDLSSASISYSLGDSKYTDLGAGITDYITRYWNVTPSGITGSINYDISFAYTNDDVVGSESEFVPLKHSGGAWTTNGSIATGSNTVTWNDATSFSVFTAGDEQSGPLPVELLSFSAEIVGDIVQLSWVTGSEVNNSHFIIERSDNVHFFEMLEAVEGHGTTAEQHEYEAFDDDPFPNVSYYRLKQVDFDGAFEYGPIAAVEFMAGPIEEKHLELHVYPNPAIGGRFTVEASSHGAIDTEMLIQLTDMHGRELYSKLIVSNEGTDFLHAIDPQGKIPPGMYMVTGSAGGRFDSEMIIIK